MSTMQDVTLGHRLAADRRARRTSRMELVVRELRKRAAERRRIDGRVPAPLGLAIKSFEEELDELRDRENAP
ncbi:MAG: hypothetical protein JHC95_01750 [Solirubrobacteraceae bacterium]|nr:hypothetical protein [Solirubrobacteraceae bacterium]